MMIREDIEPNIAAVAENRLKHLLEKEGMVMEEFLKVKKSPRSITFLDKWLLELFKVISIKEHMEGNVGEFEAKIRTDNEIYIMEALLSEDEHGLLMKEYNRLETAYIRAREKVTTKINRRTGSITNLHDITTTLGFSYTMMGPGVRIIRDEGRVREFNEELFFSTFIYKYDLIPKNIETPDQEPLTQEQIAELRELAHMYNKEDLFDSLEG